MIRRVGVSMLGCGTVGLPLFQSLISREEFLLRTVVVWDPSNQKHDGVRRHAGVNLVSSRQYDESDGRIITEDKRTHLVVEVIGGSRTSEAESSFEKTRDRLIQVLRAGKHVVTANKRVISHWGNMLYAAGNSARANIVFESAAAGSVPIVRLLTSYWRGQRIRKILGILNGTSNYVLSEMSGYQEGCVTARRTPESEAPAQHSRDCVGTDNPALYSALEHARENGLAEADPSDDLDGTDAADKLAILASLAFNTQIRPQDIPCSSITDVSPVEVEIANRLGCVIKPLAAAELIGERRVQLGVHPALLPRDHQLASVHGAYNAIYIEDEADDGFGKQLYYGQGAGGNPTATALLSDVMEVIRRLNANVVDNPSYAESETRLYCPSPEHEDVSGVITSYSPDIPGVLLAKTRAFYDLEGDDHVNIQHIINLTDWKTERGTPDAVVFSGTKYGNVRQILETLKQSRINKGDLVAGEPVFLRFGEPISLT